VDVSAAVPVETAADLDSWFRAPEHADAREIVVAILKAGTGRARVRLVDLQEVALCHGWVDTQTQRIDDERYGIRFVPRSARSTWGPKNRAMARRMLEAGRLEPSGMATLPPDIGGTLTHGRPDA
jgi:uncharacterized protein YdeI (YjbR/CyaY-like superfamily)